MVEELGGGWVDRTKGITKALGLREHCPQKMLLPYFSVRSQGDLILGSRDSLYITVKENQTHFWGLHNFDLVRFGLVFALNVGSSLEKMGTVILIPERFMGWLKDCTFHPIAFFFVPGLFQFIQLLS